MARPNKNTVAYEKYKNTNREILNKRLKSETDLYYTINNGDIVGPSPRYKVYKDGLGNYFYKKGNEYITIGDTNALAALKVNKDATTTKNPNNMSPLKPPVNQNTGSGGSTSSGSGSGSGSGGSSYYTNQINQLTKELNELKNPKVWSAKELAELYGITDQYNYDKILEQYNNATKQYYDDAIAEQLEYNENANMMNTTYANNLINKYLDSYAAQAPTAVGRGVLGANALISSLNADMAAGEVATNLNSIVRDYEKQREAELETNATNARTDYNAIGSWLLSQGAKQNEADVQRHVDTLNAYATRYAAARSAQKTLANSAAQAYQYNAQAALNNAAYNNTMKDYKYYQYWYGDNAARAYANSLKDTNTTNIG